MIQKNKIPRVTFLDDNLNTIVKGLSQDNVQKVIFDKLIPNIKVAIEKNKKECIFCYVQDWQIIIPKSSFKSTLDTLLKYYLNKEDYDKCGIVRDLLTKIEG